MKTPPGHVCAWGQPVHPSKDHWEECRQCLGQWAQGPPETQADCARCRGRAGTQPRLPWPSPARADRANGNPQLSVGSPGGGRPPGPRGVKSGGTSVQNSGSLAVSGGTSTWPLEALLLSPLATGCDGGSLSIPPGPMATGLGMGGLQAGEEAGQGTGGFPMRRGGVQPAGHHGGAAAPTLPSGHPPIPGLSSP